MAYTCIIIIAQCISAMRSANSMWTEYSVCLDFYQWEKVTLDIHMQWWAGLSSITVWYKHYQWKKSHLGYMYIYMCIRIWVDLSSTTVCLNFNSGKKSHLGYPQWWAGLSSITVTVWYKHYQWKKSHLGYMYMYMYVSELVSVLLLCV